MPDKPNYAIVRASELVELENEVNRYIEGGYEPVGGICFDSNRIQYIQAVQLAEFDLPTKSGIRFNGPDNG